MTAGDQPSISIRRLIAFVITAAAVTLGIFALPQDDARALAVTAQGLVQGDVLEPLAEQRDALGWDGPVTLRYEGPEAARSAISVSFNRVFGQPEMTSPSIGTVVVQLEVRGDNILYAAGHLEVTPALPSAELAPEDTVTASHRIGDWRALLPPVLAILIALFLRRLLAAMLSAIVLGSLLHFTQTPTTAVFEGLNAYIVGNVTSSFELNILMFTFALIGMVMVTTRAGGSQGLIDLFGRFTHSVRSTRLATAVMGLVVFFDDYANAIVVGTTARPLTDRKRISREKLAYIVDSTAAPIAGVAIISTWIAFEVGLLQSLIEQVGFQVEPGVTASGYGMFIAMLPLRLYCLVTLGFVFANAGTGRDYGPMLRAERRAAAGKLVADGARPLTSRLLSEVQAAPGIACRWYNAVIPIGWVVLAVTVGMLIDGRSAVEAAGLPFDVLSFETWKLAFGEADSSFVLLVASISGSVIAILLAIGQRLLSVKEACLTWLRGVPAVWLAVAILICAWAIRSVCDDLGTSVFLVSALGDSIPVHVFPLFAFVLSAMVAFATGTSWGTMGILLPLVFPWAYELVQASPGTSTTIVVLSAAAVLDGAIVGDHCSPISDTTVMSSIATSCDHVDHVRTQLPYALTCMLIAAGGYLAVSYGSPIWAVYGGSLLATFAVLYGLGKKVEYAPEPT